MSYRVWPSLSFVLLAIGLALNPWVLAYPEFIRSVFPGRWNEYDAASVVLVATAIATVALWPRVRVEAVDASLTTPASLSAGLAGVTARTTLPLLGCLVVGFAGLIGIGVVAHRWIAQLLMIPIDSSHADMLPVIHAAITNVLAGHDPYRLYYVPKEAPLPYGPALWGWFIIPHLLKADMRFVTVFGLLFVPALTVIGAAAESAARRYWRALIWLALGAALVLNPLFDQFLMIGHTPAYWPLLAAFVFFLSAKDHRTAAVLLGLLVNARTTQISLVPVFVIYLWWADRKVTWRAALLVVLAAALPFVPFAIANWGTLWYGMVGSYERIMKQFVWVQTPWVMQSVGLTRVLLLEKIERFEELSQAVAVGVVYVCAWFGLKRRQLPGPWLCLALFSFSMTSLWPVWYIFLDVFLLAALFLLADTVPVCRIARVRVLAATTVVLVAIITGSLLSDPGVYYTIAAGSSPRWYLRGGFGPDEVEGDRTFAAAMRQDVYVKLPRGGRTDAVIEIECEPYVLEGSGPQTIGIVLNDFPLGAQALHLGWQTVSFRAPRRAWQIGHNSAQILFSYAWPVNGGTETRAARIGHITISKP